MASDAFPALREATAGSFDFGPTTDYRGRQVLVACRPVGKGYEGWGLVAKIDAVEAYGPVRRLRSQLLVLGGGIIVLCLGASYAMARRFARRHRQRFLPEEMKTMKVARR
jgi:hypothetical protein